MKKSVSIYLSLICTLVGLFIFHDTYAQWKQDKFIIGSYVDISPDSADVELTVYGKDVQKAKAAYFNLFSGKNNYNKFVPYTNDAIQLKILRILHKNGIKTLYLTPRGKGYSDSLASAVFNFTKSLNTRQQATLLGYSIRDEPKLPERVTIQKWIGAVKQRDPAKVAYVNMFPCYAFKTHVLYEAYLDTFLLAKDSCQRPDVVSFDFYPFWADSLRKDYFYNLAVIKERAQGRPLWYFPYTTQHRSYANPGMYHLSFMAFCPVAYGGKGCIYFTYDFPRNTPEPYKYAIRDSVGRLTEKYTFIKAINHYLNDIIGPVVMKYKLYGPYHTSHQPYNQSLTAAEQNIMNIPGLKNINNPNMLCALFRDTINNNNYMYLVNKAPEMQNVTVTLKGVYKAALQVSAPLLAYDNGAKMYASEKGTVENGNTSVLITFAPGEARMIKLKGVMIEK